MQNFADCTVHTVLTWKLTIQVVRPYSDMAEEWHVDWRGVATMVESSFDMCLLVGECNGAMCPSLGKPCGTPP
jgi:hypothetical protein